MDYLTSSNNEIKLDFETKIDNRNPNIKKLIDSIKIDKKHLVIFAGAGVSKLFGLPLWNDFAYRLLEDCFNDKLIDYQTKEDYRSSVGKDAKMLITIVFNVYEQYNKKDLFYEHFEKHLTISNKNEMNQEKLKKFINALKRMNATIITTNADRLLDSAIANKNNIFYSRDFYENTIEYKNTEPAIFHIHGSVIDNDSLIFTADQYIGRYKNSSSTFSPLMESIFKNQDVAYLFIGSSMSEMELLQYIIKGDYTSSNKFILNGFYEYQKQYVIASEKYYRDHFGFTQISYSFKNKGYDNIIDFIVSLSNEFITTPSFKESFYKTIIEHVDLGDVDLIINDVCDAVDKGLSLQLISNIFSHINARNYASEFFRLLYSKRPSFFDVNYFSIKDNTIQNIVMTELSFCHNFVKQKRKKFNSFLNGYIKRIDEIIKSSSFNLVDNYKIIVCYISYISMASSKANQKRIVSIIKLLFKKNVSYVTSIFYSLSNYSLEPSICYDIVLAFLNATLYNNEYIQFYEINAFIKNNFNKIMGYNSLGYFNKLRELIIKVDEKYPYKYGDMGAIYDYVNKTSSLRYESYLVKLIKDVIDNLLPSQVLQAFNLCETNSRIDKKIKLYFIDIHYSKMKDKITLDLINSIDCISSLGWIIKNHRELRQGEDKKDFEQLINQCNFDGEDKDDVDGLKQILIDMLNDRDYKQNINIKSRYKYYDYFNIGKMYFVSNVLRNTTNVYSMIANETVSSVVDFINKPENYSFDLDDALEKYFTDDKIEQLLKQPEIFLSISDDKWYFSILKKLYSKENNTIDKSLVLDFMIKIIEKCSNGENAWLWMEILKKNNLLSNREESKFIMGVIFDKVISKEVSFKVDSDYIGFMINNNLFECTRILCELHIESDDIYDYIKGILDTYKNSSNWLILLGAISSIYDEIYESNPDIKDLLLDYILSDDDEISLCIYNGLIFSHGVRKNELINEKTFVNIFSRLDHDAIEFYSQLVLLNYWNFDEKIVQFIAQNCRTDYLSEVINCYNKSVKKDINSLINIIFWFSSNNNVRVNISKDLLELLIVNFSNHRLKDACRLIAFNRYEYIDWEELEPAFKKLMSLNEDYFISSIFIPLSDMYLAANRLYIEDEFIEIFDHIYNSIINRADLELMEGFATRAFDLGIEKFAKYN